MDRPQLSCGNFAHGFAAAGEDKDNIRTPRGPNIGIVTAYNDMLSAHQPYGRYPEQMKLFAREVGATAQVAGGVPAMCDGVTQGQPGHGAVAVQPRRDRDGDRDRAVPRHVRRRGAARHLRQDRAGPADRRAALRSFADDPDPRRADALGPRQQGEAARPPALCRRQGRQGRAARSREPVLSQRPAPAPSTAPPTPTR